MRASVLEDLAGHVFGGRYRIEHRIGSGGMGTVYVAEQIPLARKVAIKVIRRDLASGGEALNRFRREAEALAAIAHPGVVSILDFGFDEATGSTYIAMEYLDGETLHERCRRVRRTLALTEIVPIIELTLDSLDAIHSRGFIHRDIKPANLFLMNNCEGSGSVKIVDLGITKLLNNRWATLTAVGTVVGTPRFMASEQVRGQSDIDVRADLCSVGRVLYWALSRQPPFGRLSNLDLLHVVSTQSPAPVANLCDGLHPEIASVIDRANHVDRNARFPTAPAMRDALREAYDRALVESDSASLSVAFAVTQSVAARSKLGAEKPEKGTIVADRYEVLDEIAPGGSSRVFRAKHLVSHRIVALKIMLGDARTDETIRERFEREAQAVAQVHHPGLTTVWDAGIDAQGRCFLAMELLVGETLAEVLEHGPLPLDRVLSILRHLVDAVAVLHQVGIVHRDIKPHNLFLARGADLAEQVKLLDFGITRLAAEEPDESEDDFAGTVAYMPPDRITHPDRIEPAADIWSIGVVVYQMVAGRLPFEAENAVELIGRILNEAHLKAHEVCPDLPLPLSRLVDRCLEKNPDRRIQNGRGLRVALDEACSVIETPSALEPAPEPTTDHFPSISTAQSVEPIRVLRPWTQSPWLRFGGVVALAAIAGSGVWLALQATNEEERPTVPIARPSVRPQRETPQDVLDTLLRSDGPGESPEAMLARGERLLAEGRGREAKPIFQSIMWNEAADSETRAWARVSNAQRQLTSFVEQTAALGVISDHEELATSWRGLNGTVSGPLMFQVGTVTGTADLFELFPVEGERPFQQLTPVSLEVQQCAWLQGAKAYEFVVEAADLLSGGELQIRETGVRHSHLSEELETILVFLTGAGMFYEKAFRVTSHGRCAAESAQRHAAIVARLTPLRPHSSLIERAFASRLIAD